MSTSRIALFALAAALAAPACASVLYKSVGSNGVIQFSDQPPDRAQARGVEEIRIRDTEPGPVAAVVEGPSAEAQWREADEAVQRANAQLDLAEHALAEARRAALAPQDPMRLVSARPSHSDYERIEFYKKDVLLARANLLEVVARKRKADSRVTFTASSDWTPIVRR